MNEQLINELCEKFHTTVDNLIPVYSNYIMIKDLIGIIISLIFIAIGALILIYIYHGYKNKKYDEYAVMPLIIGASAGFLILGSIIGIIINLYDYILWYNYPALRFLDTVLQIGG